MDPLKVFDIGRGRFVVDVRLWGKGKRSGDEVDQRFAFLYTLRRHRSEDRPMPALSHGPGRNGFRDRIESGCAHRLIGRGRARRAGVLRVKSR
jgi:hypothetical protein